MLLPADATLFLELRPFGNSPASKKAATDRWTVWEWCRSRSSKRDGQWFSCCCFEHDKTSRRGWSKVTSRFIQITMALCLAALVPCTAQTVDTQQRPEYFIDVLAVSDVPIYRTWYTRASASAGLTRREATLNDLRRYFTLVLQEVNERFRTLEVYNNFRLTVRPVGFYIAESEADSQWTVSAREGGVGQVDAGIALRNLARWVVSTPGLPAHDHTMLMTGYDLVTDDYGVLFRYTIGLATVGTVCQGRGRSVSVVEDRGAFQSVHTAAHELAHSLGAGHDGTGNTTNCRAADRYIMAGGTEPRTAANLRHPWFFSPCSAREIARYVNILLNWRAGRQCLSTAVPQIGVPDVQGLVPGQLYNPDQQCQHIYGPRSRYCYGGNFGSLREICTSMFCLVPDDRRGNLCVEYHAAHGTSCAPGRWCEEGACVAHPNAPKIRLEGCLYGDELTLINGRGCSAAVRQQPALCNNPGVRAACCASCDPRRQPHTAACPFGDRVSGCQSALCNTLLPDGTPYARDCCGTCGFDVSRWTCADSPQGVNGLSCEKAIRVGQVQGCYNATLAFWCCASCQGQRSPVAQPGCEYEDLLLDTCQIHRKAQQTCSRQLHWQCCQTCHDNDVLLRGVTLGMTSSGKNSGGFLHSTIQVVMWSMLVLCRPISRLILGA